jgi:Ca-activated chloride channel family protein
VFFTDGYIGNERTIIGAIQQMLGPSRLHAFGVGGNVNRYLLDRMAAAGRGTVQYVLLNDKPEAVAERFAERLAKPVLTDVSVKFKGATVRDLVPSYIPDVLDGRPVLVHGRYDRGGRAKLEVVGRIGAKPSAATVEVELAGPDGEHSPLPSVWARQQIKQLEMDRSAGGADAAAIDDRILELALEHALMTRLTAFVAIDETPAEVAGAPSKFVHVPTAMAKDVSYHSTVSHNTMPAPAPAPAPVAQGPRYQPPVPAGGRRPSGGGFGGGPVSPVFVVVAGVLAALELRRRRRR